MTGHDVVIVSSAADLHADAVAERLNDMGREPVRLNTDDIPMHATLSFAFPEEAGRWCGGIRTATAAGTFDMDGVRSLWWRRPLPYFGLPGDLPDQQREFARSEIDHAVQGLWSLLGDRYWVSHPERIRAASWKMEQLHRAAGHGFDVPATLVTSDPEEARRFYAACSGDVVYKVLSDPFLGAPAVAAKHPDGPPPELLQIRTTLVTDAMVDELDDVQLAPCLFQAYIPKQVEIRVTVIGDELFAVEIDSQAHEGTRVDWRNWDDGGFEIAYRKIELPSELAERCMTFVRSYGLNFSAIDLVLTPDGRYVFLENNPNGQFIWIEKFVPELRMIDALAACLVRGGNG